jgi:dihydrolipoamide dehydrogenase
MANPTYDAVVIGAGPGGYVAAIRLAQLGQKTALVEREALGGVCLNWGCIPSKALIAAANLVEDMKHATDRGIFAEAPRVDLGKLRDFKNAVVKKLVGGVGMLEKGNGVEVVKGTAAFVAPDAIEVAAGDGARTRIQSKAFIVATGARPIELPGFPFGPDVWSAKEAVDLPELPKRLVIIGGGIIGMELGTVYAKLGSQVTFLEALPQILTGVDMEAVRLVQKRGGDLVVKAEVEGKALELPCDKILCAVGFKPAPAGLGLEQVGVKLTARGFVEVNEQYRTSVPSIYAIGDIAGPPLLAHKAFKEGEIAAEVIAGMKTVRDWVALPSAIFTDPEVATVGLSEEEARKAGYDPLVGKFPFAALGRAIAIDHTEGFVKVVGDRTSKLLLGVTMCGPEASDLVAEAALALEMGAYLEDVALTIHAHPTLPEAFMEACKAALGEAIHALNRPERPRKAEAGAPARA